MFDFTTDTEYSELQKAILFAFLPSWGRIDPTQYREVLSPRMFGIYENIAWPILSGEIKDSIYESKLFWHNPELFWELSMTADSLFWMNIGEHIRRFVQVWMRWEFLKTKETLNTKDLKKLHRTMETLDNVCNPSKGFLSDIFEETTQAMETARVRGVGYKLWLSAIDNAIWWLRQWCVTRLSGYSNKGKSRFMYQTVNRVLEQWGKCLILNLEVPRQYCLMYLASNFSNIPSQEIEKGANVKAVSTYVEKYKDKLRILDDVFDIDGIVAQVRNAKEDVIFIDFVQNIKASGWSEYEAMTEVAREIQRVANDSWKHIFDLSQVSNEGNKYKTWDMIPSKGSGSLVASADIGLVIHWENWDIKITLAKNKFWPKDIEVALACDFSTSSFKSKIWF